MRRNLLLILTILVGLILAYNSVKKIASFRGTSDKIAQAQTKLDALKKENEDLKQELDYKKSEKFQEEEIRNKLGLAKPGEQVYVVPKSGAESSTTNDEGKDNEPNWQKWKDYFF